ncbi:unnamed protein product [Polarella glacialis]|uniref:Ion transport domain-containing protein n=1 Tax=Polarella glacialis TaxID=89957 RepID=A0A813G878_POLGL|nr:unnamed protein product [Polarella glacialis]
MAMVSPSLSPTLRTLTSTLSGLLLIMFTAEIAVKMFVFGPVDFCKDKWNAYDLVAVLGSCVAWIVRASFSMDELLVQFLGVFQIARMLMLVRYAWFLDSLVSTLGLALPGLVNVTGLLGLAVFMYSCLGVSLFGTVMTVPNDGREQNFQSFGNSLMALMRCGFGERWHEIMYELASDQANCTTMPQTWQQLAAEGPRGCGTWLAYPFFVSYVVAVNLILMNLICAVVLDSYNNVHELIYAADLEYAMKCLSWEWHDKDKGRTGYLPLETILVMLSELPEPLGFGKSKKRHILHAMRHLHVHEGMSLHYRDIVLLLAKRAVIFLRNERLELTNDVELDQQAKELWCSQFPDLPKLGAEFFGMHVAHLIITKRMKIYIRMKRGEWAQRKEEQRQIADHMGLRQKVHGETISQKQIPFSENGNLPPLLWPPKGLLKFQAVASPDFIALGEAAQLVPKEDTLYKARKDKQG